jgi:ankyrin repeat protein
MALGSGSRTSCFGDDNQRWLARNEESVAERKQRCQQRLNERDAPPPGYSERATPVQVKRDFLKNLSAAIEKGDNLATKRLLDARPGDSDIDALDSQAQVPLSLAVQKGNEVAIRLLLANGAVPTRRDGRGQRAIDYAENAENTGKDEILKLLLQPPAVGTQPETKLPSQEVEKPAPALWPDVDTSRQELCRKSSAFVLTYRDAKIQRNYEMTVYDLIYDEAKARAAHSSESKPSIEQSNESPQQRREWTWIHLPSNNVSREALQVSTHED